MAQTTKSKTKIWVTVAALALAAILCGIMTQGFVEWNPYCWFGHKYNEANVCVRCGKDKPEDEHIVALASVAKKTIRLNALRAANNTAPSVTIKATITPDDVSNKLVDWSVAWATPESDYASGKNVTDYVTVTPTVDGSLTATVTCLQAFSREESILVICTSRDSLAQAECVVTFVGTATTMNINVSGTALSDAKIDTYYEVGQNKTLSATISLDNYFHDVNPEHNYTVTWTGHGTILVETGSVYTNGTVSAAQSPRSLKVNTVKDKFAEVTLTGSTLSIKGLSCIEDYNTGKTFQGWGYSVKDMYRGQGTDSDTMINGVGTAVKPYFQVVVTDTVSGLSQSFYFRVVATTSVSLNQSTIQF